MSDIPRIEIEPGLYCYNIDSKNRCMAYNTTNCKEGCPARIGTLNSLLRLYRELRVTPSHPEAKFYKDQIQKISKEIQEEQRGQIMAAYYADTHRGSKGGSSESDSNVRAGLKQLMKDNRSQECKWTDAEKQEIKTLTEEWEAKHGKLPKLSRSIVSRGKSEDKRRGR